MKIKKILSLLLAVLLLLSLLSCGDKNRSYDEAEVKAAAEELIKKSERLNKIFWGEGIPYVEEYGYTGYYPADPIYLMENGFLTVDDLKEDAEKVFSTDYCISIRTSVFSSSAGDYGMVGYVRYYQGTDTIMVYKKYKPLLTDTVEYDYSNISVIGSKGEIVTVNIPIKVTRGNLSQERVIKIDLVEEKDGWRIDSPTYASYRAE